MATATSTSPQATATHNKVYVNTGGTLDATAAWTSDENESTRSIAWADWDGDGDLDLAAGQLPDAESCVPQHRCCPGDHRLMDFG